MELYQPCQILAQSLNVIKCYIVDSWVQLTMIAMIVCHLGCVSIGIDLKYIHTASFAKYCMLLFNHRGLVIVLMSDEQHKNKTWPPISSEWLFLRGEL